MYLLAQLHSLCFHILIDLQLVAVVEDQVIIVPENVEYKWRVSLALW